MYPHIPVLAVSWVMAAILEDVLRSALSLSASPFGYCDFDEKIVRRSIMRGNGSAHRVAWPQV
jgi:hypothetical protein